MFGLILLASSIAQAAAGQARLHPADAFVFVEVPDVPKLMEAYKQAPLVQLVHDPAVRKAFNETIASANVDLDAQIYEGLKGIGMPDEFAHQPGDKLLEYLSSVQALSFSLSMPADGATRLAGELGPRAEAAKELAAISNAITMYRAKHDNALPASLDELARNQTDLPHALTLDEKALTDPWGKRYEYTPQPAEGEGEAHFALRSLGTDGKPGGEGPAADIAWPDVDTGGGFGKGIVREGGLLVVCEMRSDAAANDALGFLTMLADKGGVKRGIAESLPMAGANAEVVSWSTPGDVDAHLWTLRAGRWLAIGAGHSFPKELAARFEGAQTNTAAANFQTSLSKELPAAQGATVVQGFVRMSAYVDALRTLARATGEDESGIDFMDSSLPDGVLRMQLVADRFVTEIASKRRPDPMGLATMVGNAPIPPTMWTSVPDDAIGIYGTSIDGPAIYRALMKAMAKEKTEPGQPTPAQKLAEFEKRAGFSVEKDVCGSLGGGVVAYMLPIAGVLGPPGLAIVVDLRDPVAFQRGIEGVLKVLEEESEGEFSLRNKPYKDQPMWTVTFGKDDEGAANPLAAAFSPTLTIVKNRMIITLNPARAKKEIKRALGEEGALHLIATEGHKPPAEASTFAYMDWAAFLNGAYDGARGLAGMVGAGNIPFDVSKLPTAQTFSRFFRPTVFFSKSTPTGTYMRNESSFGPETWIGIMGLGAGAALVARGHSQHVVEDGDESASVEVETPEPPSDVSVEQGATHAALNTLATAISVYQLDTGHYPAALADLLSATTNYPHGFLPKSSLPKDGWGRDLRYRVESGRASYHIWSVGADGVDQSGAGDDVTMP